MDLDTTGTQQLHRELLAVKPPSSRAARAEVTALLRFGGGLRILEGKLILEATVGSHEAARRLGGLLYQHFGAAPRLVGVPGEAHTLRVYQDAELLARGLGLVGTTGRPVVGMPTTIVGAAFTAVDVAAGALRGAALASGGVGVNRIEAVTFYVRSPGLAAAMAVGGFARKLRATHVLRERLGGQGSSDFMVVRHGLRSLMEAIGAPVFAERCVDHYDEPDGAGRIEPLRMQNHLRATVAGHATAAQVRNALRLLGSEVTAEVAKTAELRMAYPDATLSELGERSDPPITKNAVAGRLRRLVMAGERRSHAMALSA